MDIKSTVNLLSIILQDANKKETVKIWSKQSKRIEFHQASFVKSEYNLSRILRNFPEEDTYISFNTFKNRKKGKAGINDLFNVYAFCVDVDYKHGKNKDCSVKEAIAHFSTLDNFLKPAYIEYGNQFRLIYLIKGHLSTKKQFKAINLVAKRLVEQLNSYEDFDFHAETQGLQSFIRIAGSINTKEKLSHSMNWVWNEEKNDYICDFGEESVVHYMTFTGDNGRYSLSEYMDSVLGIWNEPDWYQSWKKKGKSQKKMHSSYSLNASRIRDIEEVQRYCIENDSEFGNRNNLCFIYFVHRKLQVGIEDAMKDVEVFNQRFQNPLLDKELEMCISTAKKKNYLYKDETFYQFLSFIHEDLDLECLGQRFDRKAYQKEYYQKKSKKKALKKEKQALNRKKQIKKYRNQGKTNAQIAKILHISLKTLERYITELIRKQEILSRKVLKKGKEIIEEKKQRDAFLEEFEKACVVLPKICNRNEKEIDTLLSDLRLFGRILDSSHKRERTETLLC